MSATNDTQNAIVNFLNYSGHHAWRNNTQGTYDPTKKIWRKQAKSMSGPADVQCCLKGGRHLEVEVKTGKDRMRESQLKHRDWIAAVGGLYVTVGSYDEFRQYYDTVIQTTLRIQI
jgi:hypothetical protein